MLQDITKKRGRSPCPRPRFARAAKRARVMQINQARHAEQDLARALGEGERQRRIGRQPRERREQQIAALLHPEGARDGERRAADRLPQALEQQRIDPAHRVSRTATVRGRPRPCRPASRPGSAQSWPPRLPRP